MKYKLVCFDVDGTLIDNLEYSWSIFHNYFQVDQKRREKAKKAFYDGEITYLDTNGPSQTIAIIDIGNTQVAAVVTGEQHIEEGMSV